MKDPRERIGVPEQWTTVGDRLLAPCFDCCHALVRHGRDRLFQITNALLPIGQRNDLPFARIGVVHKKHLAGRLG